MVCWIYVMLYGERSRKSSNACRMKGDWRVLWSNDLSSPVCVEYKASLSKDETGFCNIKAGAGCTLGHKS